MSWKGYLSFLKLSIKHIINILAIIFLFQTAVLSQTDSVDSSSEQKKDTIFVMHKSPWGAVLRSAILPGWGQIYNESYIKVPIVWGIIGSLAAGWIWNNNKYNNANDLYHQNLNDSRLSANYKFQRNFYRDQRDLFAIYIGLAYFLNMVDAYVDAQLFDFTVKENPFTKQPWLNLNVRF